MNRIVLLGGAGRLGVELRDVFGSRIVAAPTRAQLDLEDTSALATLLHHHRPDVVVTTAAFHDVEACELRPDRAFAVNALAVDRLAGLCALARIRLVHVSTDYVFDGTASEPYREIDATAPLSAYGASKLAGEHLLTRHGGAYVIVRTSGLYGARGISGKGPSFPERMLALARSGRPLRVVDDVVTTPTATRDVARRIGELVDREASGLFHVTNAGACTWHAFTVELLRLAGLDVTVEATTNAAFPSLVRRPAYSVLANDATAALGLSPLRGWRDALAEFVSDVEAARAP